ncbi:MAG: DUF4116 domain-containing protein [Clostridia bacterium]|nr:DUF4116 domain-containing protein [Clostridia bacterium]
MKKEELLRGQIDILVKETREIKKKQIDAKMHYEYCKKVNEIVINTLKELQKFEIMKGDYSSLIRLIMFYQPYAEYEDFDNLNYDKNLKTTYQYVNKYLDEKLLKDKDFVIEYVTIHLLGLAYIDEKFRNDFDVVLSAVKSDGYNIMYASENLRDNEIIVKAALYRHNPMYPGYKPKLYYVSDRLRDDEEICKRAIEENLSNSLYVSERLKNSDEFSDFLLKERYGLTIKDLDTMTIDEIFKKICQEPKFSILDLPQKYRNNKELMKKIEDM